MSASLVAGSLMAGFFVMRSKQFRVTEDLEALLARMRQRLYPETLPVLGFYWLKTVKASGYGRRQWKKLNRLLKRALGEQLLDGPSRQAIADIQTWIQQRVLVTGRPPRSAPTIYQSASARMATSGGGPPVDQRKGIFSPGRRRRSATGD
jgi:hypothetical protein